MKKVLVTGATGFIGQYVINVLLEKNYQVIATSSSKEKAAAASWFSRVRYIPFDLHSFDPATDYFRFFDSPDLVIHLAWEGLPNYTAAFHVDDNLPRHKAFLDNMLKNGLRDLTVTGTCLEYGMQQGKLQETMEPRPSNAYAIAKNELRKAIGSVAVKENASFKWVRLFYMYGKGQNPKSLISQLDKALENGDTVFNMSGGEQVRDFLPVEKMARYIVAIADQQKITGIINCCSGQPVALKDFVTDYLKAKNQHITLNLGYYPYTDYEPMEFWGDNEKLKSITSNV